MRFSVIIPTYDVARIKDLTECVDSVLRQNCSDFELVVVVDNNVNLCRLLTQRYVHEPRIKVVLNDCERGLSAGMNCGVLHAKGQIICFIDDDAVADKDWLSEFGRAYDNDEDICAVGGCLVPLWIGKRPGYLPKEFYWMIGATGSYLADHVREVRNLWSGNVSYRRTVFDRVGLFLPLLGRVGNSFLQGEDMEFGLRLLKSTGRGVKYVPSAVVYHKVYCRRIDLRSLMRRAFQQGYSKAFVAKLHGHGHLSAERAYLKIILRSSLERVKCLFSGPDRIDSLTQQLVAVVVTIVVLFGFVRGLNVTTPRK